jgi:general secretion pathway protein A
MYLDYFRLSESPFSLTPDLQYLFMSEQHREGLAHLQYGTQQAGGFVQLTGEIGCGKTTLCRCLIQQLPPDTDVALILNPRLTAVDLLASVCDELRISYPPHTESIKVLIDALNQRLLETHAQRRRTVLIIDEAQDLHCDVLEQIRLLTNLETSKEKLLQIVLIGQPELLALLNGPGLKQLTQRITARYHLHPLSRNETYAYIRYRLMIAGRQDPIFTQGAMRWIYRLSRGVPRVVNIIGDRALLGAYAKDKRNITADIIRKAGRETGGRRAFYRRISLVWTAGLPLLAALALGGGLYLNTKVRSVLDKNEAAATKASSFNQPSSSTWSLLKKTEQIPGESERIIQKKVALLNALLESATSKHSCFAALYALWGVKNLSDSSDLGCNEGMVKGFECLSQNGSWPKLRRYNLPAILELLLPNGEHRQVVLAGLKEETATLLIEGRRYEFPILEINRLWDGSFFLLWKPPFSSRMLSLGAQGAPVAWIQRTLNRLEGRPANANVSAVFEDSLKKRILAFQREKTLIPDGCVGPETLARLFLASEGDRVPRLSLYDQ